MKLVAGLGNPGKEYENTRHNCGFRVLDTFADMAGVDFNKEDFKGVYTKFKIDDEDVILLKPMTMMNLSGTSVQEVVKFFKIPTENIIVVFDDMAIEPGQLRLRQNGSSGGQKGMQNIIDCLGTQDIKRIRVGIGEPKFGAIDWVLGKPTGEDKDKLEDAINRGAEAIRTSLMKSFEIAMSYFNGGGKS